MERSRFTTEQIVAVCRWFVFDRTAVRIVPHRPLADAPR